MHPSGRAFRTSPRPFSPVTRPPPRRARRGVWADRGSTSVRSGMALLAGWRKHREQCPERRGSCLGLDRADARRTPPNGVRFCCGSGCQRSPGNSRKLRLIETRQQKSRVTQRPFADEFWQRGWRRSRRLRPTGAESGQGGPYSPRNRQLPSWPPGIGWIR